MGQSSCFTAEPADLPFPFHCRNKNNKMPLAKDLLHPRPEDEKRKHKLKACATSQLILHGCQVPRMLQDHNCFQSCTNCCSVRWLLHSPLSAHWWPGKAHRRMFL